MRNFRKSDCSRRLSVFVACAFAFALSTLATVTAQAQPWPAKTVRIVVPFSVGGTTDLLARILAQSLTESTGQTFIVENKTGGGGAIGAGEVARAAPDGYTLLLTTASTHSIAPNVMKLPYDTVADFTPIVHLADSDIVMLASPTLGVKTMPELLALAKARPGFLNYSSSGVGTFAHLTFELFSGLAGVQMNHIPYRGTGSVIQDLTAGHVHLALDATATGIPHATSGRAIGVGLTGPKSSVPGFAPIGESVPGFSVLTWFGMYGPKGMSPELQAAVNAAFVKVLTSPQMAERIKTMSLEAKPGSAADFAAMVTKDRELWKRVVTDRKIKVE